MQFAEIDTRNGHVIGVATLTRGRSLNSLLLETVALLQETFSRWMQDENVVCMVLQSDSDRAFCAGGDIQALYHEIKAADGKTSPYADAFLRASTNSIFISINATNPSSPGATILLWVAGLDCSAVVPIG